MAAKLISVSSAAEILDLPENVVPDRTPLHNGSRVGDERHSMVTRCLDPS